MGSNIIELPKLGHERVAELKASCGAVDVRSLAQLISDLATQLEVQFVRSTNMAVQLANAESKCRELAAECAGMKAAFDKPQAYLSWHAIPPT
ncbi:MAG: eae-like domain protein, partial [Gammaproteobacteria bacterium]|nr:eae-like domain protein [Gammaproteobacteria bacterium]